MLNLNSRLDHFWLKNINKEERGTLHAVLHENCTVDSPKENLSTIRPVKPYPTPSLRPLSRPRRVLFLSFFLFSSLLDTGSSCYSLFIPASFLSYIYKSVCGEWEWRSNTAEPCVIYPLRCPPSTSVAPTLLSCLAQLNHCVRQSRRAPSLQISLKKTTSFNLLFHNWRSGIMVICWQYVLSPTSRGHMFSLVGALRYALTRE